MKFWYKAVCDEHKEYADVLVRANHRIFGYTQSYLEDREENILAWLELHSECSLRLIHRDDELDAVHEAGYCDALRALEKRRKK